jgi:ATP adenylyltransferase
MKTLWAPWRMEYILGEKEQGCIFCVGLSDKGKLTLFRGPLSMVMMNRYPYSNGHLLVAPRKHVASLDELSVEEMGDILKTVNDAIRILGEVMQPEGFNVGLNLGEVAGAGVEQHLHFHIVPRWHGDTNAMTVLGEVRVISEHLESTFKRLKPHFAALE